MGTLKKKIQSGKEPGYRESRLEWFMYCIPKSEWFLYCIPKSEQKAIIKCSLIAVQTSYLNF